MKTTISILGNTDSLPLIQLANRICNLVLKPFLSPSPNYLPLNETQYRVLVGSYITSKWKRPFQFRVDNNKLIAISENNRIELYPLTATSFVTHQDSEYDVVVVTSQTESLQNLQSIIQLNPTRRWTITIDGFSSEELLPIVRSAPSRDQITSYCGVYVQEDLNLCYVVRQSHPRTRRRRSKPKLFIDGFVAIEGCPLQPLLPDLFIANNIRFEFCQGNESKVSELIVIINEERYRFIKREI